MKKIVLVMVFFMVEGVKAYETKNTQVSFCKLSDLNNSRRY